VRCKTSSPSTSRDFRSCSNSTFSLERRRVHPLFEWWIGIEKKIGWRFSSIFFLFSSLYSRIWVTFLHQSPKETRRLLHIFIHQPAFARDSLHSLGCIKNPREGAHMLCTKLLILSPIYIHPCSMTKKNHFNLLHLQHKYLKRSLL